MRRLRLITIAIASVASGVAVTPQAQDPLQTLLSPDGKVVFAMRTTAGPLMWTVSFHGRPVIQPSTIGIVVGDVLLGRGGTIRKVERYETTDKYAWRGTKSEVVDRSNGMRVDVTSPNGARHTVEVRVANAWVAFRHVVPGAGRRVPDGGSTFAFPKGTTVWSHGLRDHYEAVYERRLVENVPDGDWAAPPVTFKLGDGGGYAAITEADLRNYAGMALQGDGHGGYRERLAHSHPPGYPYTLRFGEENAKRLSVPVASDGPITTPWRVIMLGRDLNALVNSDAVHTLTPPPDTRIFPKGFQTPWLKPGRAVWRYLDGGENTVAGIKEFSRLAGELGFEHQVVEGQWQKWTSEELRDVIDYSRSQGVSIWLWRHRNTLEDPVKRRELFASLRKAGVAGVKVDFLDHEAREVIDLYQDILRDAAEHQLMINFHGANKPAGQSRTWPNEMTREGIYGLEHRRMEVWATFNTTFPFVRMLAGHADYTPVVFSERRRETSWAHQIASAAVLTSPLLVYGGHPASLLSSPAVEMIKSIPSIWDETRVVPPSEIGEVAVFARRSGDRWFVAAMNGPTARTVTLDLSFLPAGTWKALVVRDNLEQDAAVVVETRSISAPFEIQMRAAGGFVVRLTR